MCHMWYRIQVPGLKVMLLLCKRFPGRPGGIEEHVKCELWLPPLGCITLSMFGSSNGLSHLRVSHAPKLGHEMAWTCCGRRNPANPTFTFETPSSTIRGILAPLQTAKTRKSNILPTRFNQHTVSPHFPVAHQDTQHEISKFDLRSLQCLPKNIFFKALRSQVLGFAMAPDERNHTYYEFWQKSDCEKNLLWFKRWCISGCWEGQQNLWWMMNMWWYVVICGDLVLSVWWRQSRKD